MPTRADGRCGRGLHDLTLSGSRLANRQCRACRNAWRQDVIASKVRRVVPRTCAFCGAAFTVSGRGSGRQYCSGACSQASKASLRARPAVTRACLLCGTAFTAAGRALGRQYCSERCNRVSEQKRHNENAASQARRRQRDFERYQTDPEYRLHAVQKSDRRRRVEGAEVIPASVMWLEQDGKCYLCGGQMHPIRVERRYDPLLASVEHRIPRVDGGRHDRENVSLAHLRCNLRKGRRTVEEALRAIQTA